MKSILVLLVISVVLAVVNAEPPRFRQQFRSRFFQRQELEPTTESATDDPTTTDDAPYPPASGPYPPSGWKPSGRLLALPARQSAAPPSSYVPPQEPGYAYGPPAEGEDAEKTPNSTTEQNSTEEPSTDEPESENIEVESVEQVNTNSVNQPQFQQQGAPGTGVYFVQLPSAQVQYQPLIYLSGVNSAASTVSARLQALPTNAQTGQLLIASPNYVVPSIVTANNSW